MKSFDLNNIAVSVCIVNWNTRNLLYKCVQSIRTLTRGVNYEIIIVDNDSKDNSIALVKKYCPECIIVESRENLGFGKGNNKAVRKASGKYIFYLNPDTELITNAIYKMYKCLEDNGTYGAVGVRLVGPDGKIQFTCARTFPTPFRQFSYLSMLNRLFPNSRMLSAVEMDYWDHSDSREVDCISGACIMVRKEIVDQLNGFDENIFMYAEDVDLCFRIKERGWKIYYLATELIFHHEGASSKKRADRYFSTVMQRESNYYFLSKHFGRGVALKYKIAVCLGSLIRLFLIIISAPSIISGSKRMIIDIFGKYMNILLWAIGIRNVNDLRR